MSDPMIAGGTSAAAVARGLRRTGFDVAAADDDSTGGVSISPGLGLFPAALADQHFLARGRFGRLLVAIDALDQFDLAFGIDENTALVVDGERTWAVGASGVVVIDERGSRREGRALLGARVHLLGTGDQFDLGSRRVTPAAGKVAVVPGAVAPVARGGAAEQGSLAVPADVFASWEFLRLLDRFAASSVGTVSAPFAGGELVLRKSADFRATAGGGGAGVQSTAAGLGFTGLSVDLVRR
jgi:hypothetical protein